LDLPGFISARLQRIRSKPIDEIAMSVRSRKPLLYEPGAPDSPEPASNPEGAIYKDDGLLSVAGPVMIVCYGVMFGIAGLTFFGSGQALFVLSICAVFAFLYFAIPVTLLRIRAARDRRWMRDAVKARDPVVEVGTGSVRRWEAIIQIVSIPVAIVIGFALFALRWRLLGL
jgi:hypothetical protein